MERLYYLAGDLDSTEQISTDLHRAGISDWNFHVLSKDDAGLYKRHVHSANFIHKLDLVRHAERGAIIGFVAALIATTYVILAEPFGPKLSGLVYVAIFGFITLFGAWVGGLAGIATENQQIASFHDEIEAGKYLLLIDVRLSEEVQVKRLLAENHPEAQFLRSGSTLPNPFQLARSAA